MTWAELASALVQVPDDVQRWQLKLSLQYILWCQPILDDVQHLEHKVSPIYRSDCFPGLKYW